VNTKKGEIKENERDIDVLGHERREKRGRGERKKRMRVHNFKLV